MTLASNHDDPPILFVYALKQKKGKQPVAEIVCREGGVEAIVSPGLLTKVLKASVEDESADRWELACGNAGLRRGSSALEISR